MKHKLPPGATMLHRPTIKKVGGWIPLTYDAKVVRFGLTWFRVKGGFGDHGDREDWVADIPAGCLDVNDYQWREPRWGLDQYSSFDEAVIGEMKSAARRLESEAEEALKRHVAFLKSHQKVRSSLSKAAKK